jgi:hypothetical protein
LDATALLEIVPFDYQYFSDVIARSPFKSILPTRTRPEDLCDVAFRHKIAARLLSKKLNSAQEELFSEVATDMVFPLIGTEREKNTGLTASLLRHCAQEERINPLSEAEQAFALLLACWREPAPTIQRLFETQELLNEAVFLRETCFDIHMYFSFATLWGRYVQPMMHTQYAPKLKAGFLQSNMRGALMLQVSELHNMHLSYREGMSQSILTHRSQVKR